MQNSEQSLCNQYQYSIEHGKRSPAMLQFEGFVDKEVGQPHKRSRSSSSEQWSQVSNECLSPPLHQKPTLMQVPLGGFKLTKSPLLQMMQMKLCQDNASCVGTLQAKDLKLSNQKFKPSNFKALHLRIGSWEFHSNSAGLGLKAKIYFAKHKLIWELLDGHQKYKMEIQWSDIIALKANCPNKQPGTLRVMLDKDKQPLFFKETEPQPKKQTMWEKCEDFTGGQATTHRQHFLEIPQGVLDEHYQKLLQCDATLRLLSKLPEPIWDSPDCVSEASSNSVELRDHSFNQFETARGSFISVRPLQDVTPLFQRSGSLRSLDKAGHEDLSKNTLCPSSDCEKNPLLSSLMIQQRSSLGDLFKAHEDFSKDTPPSSVIGSCATKVNANSEVDNFQNLKDLQQFGVPVCPSIDDRVACVDRNMSEPCFEIPTDSDYDLDLFWSNETTASSDDFRMSYEELFNYRGDGSSPLNRLVLDDSRDEEVVEPENKVQGDAVMVEEEKVVNDVTGHKQVEGMSDSNVEFLHGLPRILRS